jgi:DNA-binding helix-hairpin-helix protein with protein kinase domain
MSNYVDSSGNRIALDRELGKGGEGAVFAIAGDSSLVAKIYHDEPPPYPAEKLAAMAARANPQLNTVTAWPTRLIFDTGTKKFVGFVMPRISNFQQIQRLYNPRQRVQFFAQSTWKFQVRAACNLAAAFDEVHKAGCLVGDVNERNTQVSAQALVRLVDCDSFQVRENGKSFLCKVGVAQYIPPELQGQRLEGLVRTENHDRFGLAVLIYQLLFVGRHPYQGLYRGSGDPSFEQLIKEFRFAQGPAASSWSMSPPPHVPTFADIHPDLGMLFRRAFERGSENNSRPKPQDWFDVLSKFEKSLAKCTRDAGHSYWGGAGTCTWCRLERNGGPEYYFGIGDTTRGFALDERKLQDVLRRLEQSERITATYNRADHQPPVSVSENPIPTEIARLGNEIVSRTQQLAQHEADAAARERQDREQAGIHFKKFEASLMQRFAQKTQELEGELQAALTAVAKERQVRELLEPLLLGPALFGVGLLLGTLYHWLFAVIGGMIALGFGMAFAIYFYRARHSVGEMRVAAAANAKKQAQFQYSTQHQAAIDSLNLELRRRHELRQAPLNASRDSLQSVTTRFQQEFNGELERLRQALLRADQRVQTLEGRWRNIVDAHVREQHVHREKINEAISRCRSLATEFATDSKRVTANAEATARLRHLRLFSLSDAGIPGIGFGRVQILASHGICTAADIEEYRIRQINGFKDVLTGKLLTWKMEVLKQFRFSASSTASMGELRSVISQYTSQEKQMHVEIDRNLQLFETLSSRCRAATAAIVPELRQALGDYERARITETKFRAAFTNQLSA